MSCSASPTIVESDDPNEIFTVYSDECPLSAVSRERQFSDIATGTIPGAVMGLGLTRESVGDICSSARRLRHHSPAQRREIYRSEPDGADALRSKLQQIPLGEVRAPQVNIKETSITVASPRSTQCHETILARARRACAIASGAVTVNDEQVLKADRRLSPKTKSFCAARADSRRRVHADKKGRVRIEVKKSV